MGTFTYTQWEWYGIKCSNPTRIRNGDKFKDNDTLTHIFLLIFNPPLQSPLDHNITKKNQNKWSNGDWSSRLKVDKKKVG